MDDLGQFLSKNEEKTPGPHLLLGVTNDALGFRQASIVSQDAGGRNYQVVIPFSSTVNVVAFSSFFKLSNTAGVAYPKSAVSIPVLVAAGQSPKVLELQITGGGQ